MSSNNDIYNGKIHIDGDATGARQAFESIVEAAREAHAAVEKAADVSVFRAQLQAAKDSIRAYEIQIDSLKNENEGLRLEMSDLRSEIRGLERELDTLRFSDQNQELETFREALQQSARDFKNWLKIMHLDTNDGDFAYEFNEIIRQIESGSITFNDAVTKVMRSREELSSALSANNGSYSVDSNLFTELYSAIDKLLAAMDTLAEKVDTAFSMMSQYGNASGSGSSTGAIQNTESAIGELTTALSALGDKSDETYKQITNLFEAIRGVGTDIDDARLGSLTSILNGLGRIGETGFAEKKVRQILDIISKLAAVAVKVGNARLSFDFSGIRQLEGLSVKKTSLYNLATYLPQIAAVPADKLGAVAATDFSALNNIRVSKGSMEAIANLIESLRILNETKQLTFSGANGDIKIDSSGIDNAATSVSNLKERVVELNGAILKSSIGDDRISEIKKGLSEQGIGKTLAARISDEFRDLEGEIKTVTVAVRDIGEEAEHTATVTTKAVGAGGQEITRVSTFIRNNTADTKDNSEAKKENAAAEKELSAAEEELWSVSRRESVTIGETSSFIKQQNAEFANAKKIITDYYNVLKELGTTENDVMQVGSGMYMSEGESEKNALLAERLNMAAAAYKNLIDIKSRLPATMVAELEQVEMDALLKLTAAQVNYNNAVAESTAADKQEADYKRSTAAITEYYNIKKKILAFEGANEDLKTGSDGKYYSESGRYEKLAEVLNIVTAAFQRYKSVKSSLTETQQFDLEEREARATRELAMAEQEREEAALRSSATEKQTRDYQEANYVIKELINSINILASRTDDIHMDANGKFFTGSTENQELVNYINDLIDRYNALKDSIDKLPIGKREQLIRQEESGFNRIKRTMEDFVATQQKLYEKENDSIRIEAEYQRTIGKMESVLRRATKAKNSSNESSRRAYETIETEVSKLNQMRQMVDEGRMTWATFNKEVKKSSAVVQEQTNIIQRNGDMAMSLTQRIGALAKKFSYWFSSMRIIMTIIRGIKQMVNSVIELDSAFAQLKIITNATDSEMAKFSDTAFEISKNLGQSVADVTKSIETFSRLGYSLPDASKLAEFATILANVAAVSNEEATTGLTAIIKGYGMNVEDAEHVADVLVNVGQKYAVSASEMMEAYEKSGAALAATNTSFEKSAGLIAAANAAVQNSSVVGTALKTVSARIRGSKTDMEELGEDAEDLAEGFSKYAKEIKALTGFDIMVEGTTDQFKDIYDIFNGIAMVWDKLSDTQQARVSEILGGTRQLQVISSIIGNWSDAANAYETAMTSAGVATQANSIYMDTIQARLNQLKVAFSELAQNFIGSDFVKFIVSIGAGLLKILNGVGKLISKLGGLKTILFSIGTIVATMKIDGIINSIQKLRALKFIADMKAAWVLAGETSSGITRLSNAFKLLNISVNASKVAFLGLAAAIGAVVLAYSKLVQKEQEERSAFENTFREKSESANEAKNLYEVYEAYTKVNSEVEAGIKSKDDLKQASEALAEALGEEKSAADGLSDSYLHMTRTQLESAIIDAGMARDAASQVLSSMMSDHDNKTANQKLTTLSYLPDVFTEEGASGRLVLDRDLWNNVDLAERMKWLTKAYDQMLVRKEQLFLAHKTETKEYKDLVSATDWLKESIESYNSALSTETDLQKKLENVTNGLVGKENEDATVIGNLYTDKEKIKTISEDVIKNIEDIKNAEDLLKTAEKEMLDGGLSESTIKSLSEATDDYIDYLYEENGLVKLNTEAWKAYVDQKKEKVINSIDDEIDRLESENDSYKEIIRTIKELGDEYNSLVNGNVDYNNRPYITPEKMVAAGWDEFRPRDIGSSYYGLAGDKSIADQIQSNLEQIATIFTDARTIGEGEFQYTVTLTPILDDGTVLSPQALEEYYNTLILDSGIQGILDSDEYNIVVNVVPGDDVERVNEIEEKLVDIKNKALEYARAAGLVSEENSLAVAEAIDDLEEYEKQLERLESYKTIFDSAFNKAYHAQRLEDFNVLNDSITSITSSFQTLADIQEEVANGFTMSIDKALEFAKVYPEILDGATVAADGQITLNEDVVNAFIGGKKAQLDASIDSQIASLQAEREGLVAKQELIKAEYQMVSDLAKSEEEVDWNEVKRKIEYANQILDNAIETDKNISEAYEEALRVMAMDSEAFDKVERELAKTIAYNLGMASKTAADTLATNAGAMISSLVSVGRTANSVSRAVATLANNVRSAVAGAVTSATSAVQTYAVTYGSLRGSGFNWANALFNPADFAFDAGKATAQKILSDLQSNLGEIGQAIGAIDGQIAVLEALRNKNLKDFRSNKSNSGSGGGGGGGGGSSSSDEIDYLKEQQDAFREYLKNIEHEIDVRSHFDNESKNIADLYTNLIKEVEKEISIARELGLDDTDDYIQELQKKWISYTDALKKLQDDVRNNAKDAVDDLVKIRVDMLKQEIKDRKDALDKQLDMLKEFYDKQKDMLQDQYDEEKYLEEQAEKRREVTKIQEELNRLEYDNSAWAQKRKLELAQELADAQKELDDFEKDHALDVAQEELDRLYEMQEKEIQNELDLLDEKEKDSKALYDQALEDIKNGSIELYNEMIKWNETYGDGIEDTIKNAWEEAYKALEEYKTLYDETFNGVNLENATGYTPANGPYDGSRIAGSGSSSGSGSGSSSGSSKAATPADEKKSTPAAPALAVGTAVSVKSGTKWYADSYGGGRSGTARGGKIKYINLKGTHPYNIDGLGWVKKTDIVGYAAGTRSALPGVHSVDERGDEYIFQSSDGSRYRLFSGGEKVLNARATNFLYDFANNGSQILQKLISAVSGVGLGAIRPIQNNVQLVTGDIIINGNADKSTISEIRRAQRESVEMVLREFNKLNK